MSSGRSVADIISGVKCIGELRRGSSIDAGVLNLINSELGCHYELNVNGPPYSEHGTSLMAGIEYTLLLLTDKINCLEGEIESLREGIDGR